MRIFDYLNVKHLDGCIGAIEGGIYTESTRRRTSRNKRAKSGNIDAKIVKGAGSSDTEDEDQDERQILDTKEARFDRLMKALNEDPEGFNYEEILDPARLHGLPTGTWITVACEVEVPSRVKLLSQGEELENVLNMIERVEPLLRMLKPGTELPDADQLSAARAVSNLSMDPVVVGIVEDNYPKLVGKLSRTYLEGGLPEGEKQVFGKVSRTWAEGTQYPVLALPGASLMSREQRRKAASKLTGDDVLEGPGITLEIVAIYT